MEFVTCDKLTQYDEFREDEVTQILERLLVDRGCKIIYKGKRRNPDVIAYCGNSLLIIEAKSVPSKFKVMGKDKGKPKSENTVYNQFRHYSADVIVKLMEREYQWYTKSANWVKEVLREIRQKISAKYVAVFGYHKEYINALEKRKLVLERLGYEVWLIDKEGKICKYLAT
jgi:RIO-like serine/threonine protein kinase